MLDESKTCCLA